MSELKLTEAFGKYGAKLKNPQWAFSAIAVDGSLVLSCWLHKIAFEKGGSVWRYSDCISRLRSQTHGRNLLETHLKEAHGGKLRVRIVIVATKETAIVDAGEDASKVAKTFDVRENFIGQLVSFDGDAYVIEFKKQ